MPRILVQVLAGILLLVLLPGDRLNVALAGGPLFVGSPTTGTDGQPLVWNLSTPVAYRVDGGRLGTLDNAAATARVQVMFDAWQNVPTASISYTNAGPLLNQGTFTDGDVNTAWEFSEMDAACTAGSQTPIIFDADGSLFLSLGLPSGVIGFAGACNVNGNYIAGAMAALNGRWINGLQGDGELTSFEFDQAFTHEFGHLSGLDHSQINVDVLNGSPGACNTDSLAGLPLMFPLLFCQARQPSLPILAPDDIAWISEIYPETVNAPPNQVPYAPAYGYIEGTVYFSDGVTQAQGVNVIARQVDNAGTTQNESRRIAFSVVSGYRFTGSLGQNVTGTNPGSSFGSRSAPLVGYYRIPVTPGTYRIQVESVDPDFASGSSVGPLNYPIPSPGPGEFWDSGESAVDNPATFTDITVTAGSTVSNINIILNGTAPRFDSFESPSAFLPPAPLGWLRPAHLRQFGVRG
jgi:hypothetical protein